MTPTSTEGSQGRSVGAGLSETPDVDGTFPRFDEGQMARFRGLGRSRATAPGDVLFAEGDESTDFFVIESGSVAIVQGYGGEQSDRRPRAGTASWASSSMLTGQRLYLSGVVSDGGEVIQVPVEQLREIVAEDKPLSDIILGAFMARRSILIDAGAEFKLIGSRFSPDTRRLREFLPQPHAAPWIDLEEDAEAEALLAELGVEPDETPVVIDSGARSCATRAMRTLGRGSASAPEVAPRRSATWSWSAPGRPACRRRCTAPPRGSTPGSGVGRHGGQASTSARIENYLGFPAGVSGSELAQRAGVQALKFGARLACPPGPSG